MNQTLATIVDIVQELAYIAALLLATVAVYIALQQPKVRQWLAPAGALGSIILFLALSMLVYWPISSVISDVFAFVDALVDHAEAFYPSVRCFGGVVVLVALVAGSVLLATRASERAKAEERE